MVAEVTKTLREKGNLLCKSPYSVRMRENTDKKNYNNYNNSLGSENPP